MRHVAELKLGKELSVDEVISLLDELKTKVQLLSFNGIQSNISGSKSLTGYFTINGIDDGLVSIYGTVVKISTTLNFSKLTEIYNLVKLYLGDSVVDFVYPSTNDTDEDNKEPSETESGKDEENPIP